MDELISVILPVYNVSSYLDKCMHSLVNQSYRNLEVILVDDGSTDDSGEKCECWAKKDSRIIVKRTENRGVGNARNTGIELATGKYLVFVDPDDWVHEQFIEKLWKEIKQHDADIVSCNLMLYYEQKNLYMKSGPEKLFYVVENDEKKEYLFSLTYSTGSKLYKTELFANKDNRFPDFYYEDAALFPQLVHQAKKIVHIDDGLYFYLKDRGSSTTNTHTRDDDLCRSIRYTLNYFNEWNILEEWQESLRKYFTWRLYYRYELQNGGKIPSEIYRPVYEEYELNWQEILDTRAFIWGSFNARWTIYLSIAEHICFSSFISQMLGEKPKCEIEEQNPFRYKMLESDFMQKASGEMIEASKNGVSIVIFDLLEERYDILEIEPGCYVTDSEALRESGMNLAVKNRIKAGSEQHWQLWTEACNKWIAKIESLAPHIKVVLLKMRLAKGYQGDSGYVLFDEQDSIKETNIMIEKMEKYLAENCSRILFLQVNDMFGADASCRYGCAPQYVEKNILRKYEAAIEKYIKGERV